MHFNGKAFPIILGLSAFFVEACAAFFSVFGLSKLFSGATTSVIVMAASLELAKVVTASFLYRHWDTTHVLQKIYMVAAVVVLITITSMGIYGFLSNAFQSSTIGIEKQSTQVSLYEQEVSRLTKDKESAQSEKRELQNNLNTELKGFALSDSSRRYVDANYRSRSVKRFQPAIDEKEKQIQSINKRLEELSTKVSDTKVQMIETGADVGPVIFVARLFNASISTVVQYLIFIFILVFDPLAVVLVVATNKAWIEIHPTPHVETPTVESFTVGDRRKLKERFQKLIAKPHEDTSPPAPQPIARPEVTPFLSGMPPTKDGTS